MNVLWSQCKFHLQANKKNPVLSLPPSSSLFFFLHAKTSVASSSGHQTAEMGAVTLLSGLGNPTLRQRHSARRRVGEHFSSIYQEILPSLVTPNPPRQISPAKKYHFNCKTWLILIMKANAATVHFISVLLLFLRTCFSSVLPVDSFPVELTNCYFCKSMRTTVV